MGAEGDKTCPMSLCEKPSPPEFMSSELLPNICSFPTSSHRLLGLQCSCHLPLFGVLPLSLLSPTLPRLSPLLPLHLCFFLSPPHS